MKATILAVVALVIVSAGAEGPAQGRSQGLAQSSGQGSAQGLAEGSAQGTVDRYCVTCHNARLRTGGLALDGLTIADAARTPEMW
jgi:hypothetical protein